MDFIFFKKRLFKVKIGNKYYDVVGPVKKRGKTLIRVRDKQTGRELDIDLDEISVEEV